MTLFSICEICLSGFVLSASPSAGLWAVDYGRTFELRAEPWVRTVVPDALLDCEGGWAAMDWSMVEA